ncbi:MAG: homocysteine S-methyltransferase family protein [Peptostreptococcaceae bacterium]|nr:homocysteine S-methyltransferase family protein [Peptostreptococcaceae bacterium]
MDLIEYIKSNILIFDGAMGTMLQQNGLNIGENTEVFGFENPDKLMKIHKLYLDAGADVITTNTFGANEIRLNKTGYSVEEIVDNSVKIAKKAVEEYDKTKPRFVALDLGPIGEMLEPIGKLSFEKAYEIFKRQAIQGEKSGADLAIIETMIDLTEAKAAVLAVKENTNLPIFCTMTFGENGRSFTGCTPENMVKTLEDLGVDALGVNCSLGPNQLIQIVKRLVKLSKVTIIVQANAGLPQIIDNKAIYNIDSDDFFICIEKFVKLGVSIVGGCCGTTPIYIKKISDNINNLEKIRAKK